MQYIIDKPLDDVLEPLAGQHLTDHRYEDAMEHLVDLSCLQYIIDKTLDDVLEPLADQHLTDHRYEDALEHLVD